METLIKPDKINILVACEMSGRVRESFNQPGFNVWSADLKDSLIVGNHYKGDVRRLLGMGWDVLIGFPDCTYLTNAGNRYRADNGRLLARAQALLFVAELWESGIKHICIENPVGQLNTFMPVKPQTIHPYFFGEPYLKRTCLYLRELPKLVYHKQTDLFNQSTATDYPSPSWVGKDGKKRYWMDTLQSNDKRAELKSITFKAVADAMGLQWGQYLYQLYKYRFNTK
jgi:hypothetical protein